MESIRLTKSFTFCFAVLVSGIELSNPAIGLSKASKRPWSVGTLKTTALRLGGGQRMHIEFDSTDTNVKCHIPRSSSAIIRPTLPKTVSGSFSATGDLRVFSKRSGSSNYKAAVKTCSKATKKDLSCFPLTNGLLAGMRRHSSFNSPFEATDSDSCSIS